MRSLLYLSGAQQATRRPAGGGVLGGGPAGDGPRRRAPPERSGAGPGAAGANTSTHANHSKTPETLPIHPKHDQNTSRTPRADSQAPVVRASSAKVFQSGIGVMESRPCWLRVRRLTLEEQKCIFGCTKVRFDAFWCVLSKHAKKFRGRSTSCRVISYGVCVNLDGDHPASPLLARTGPVALRTAPKLGS